MVGIRPFAWLSAHAVRGWHQAAEGEEPPLVNEFKKQAAVTYNEIGEPTHHVVDVTVSKAISEEKCGIK